jgi:hypothetical protein
MKRDKLIAVLAVLICLTAPVRAQYEPEEATGPANIAPRSDDDSNRPEKLPPDPEGNAEDLRLNGRCDKAIPIFRRLAIRGSGFEIAQYNLGLCLFDVGKGEPDPVRAASLKHEAAQAIIEAANGGLPKAQANLVAMYLDGNGVAVDPIQAGMWSLIYRANGARFTVGPSNISADLQARLSRALNEQAWQQAQSRADAWTPHS